MSKHTQLVRGIFYIISIIYFIAVVYMDIHFILATTILLAIIFFVLYYLESFLDEYYNYLRKFFFYLISLYLSYYVLITFNLNTFAITYIIFLLSLLIVVFLYKFLVKFTKNSYIKLDKANYITDVIALYIICALSIYDTFSIKYAHINVSPDKQIFILPIAAYLLAIISIFIITISVYSFKNKFSSLKLYTSLCMTMIVFLFNSLKILLDLDAYNLHMNILSLVAALLFISSIFDFVNTCKTAYTPEYFYQTYKIKSYDNLGWNKKNLLFPVYPLVLYVSGNMSNRIFIIIICILAFYVILVTYYRDLYFKEYQSNDTKEQIQSLEMIVNEKTSALERVNNRLKRQSVSDMLTSIRNRYGFYELIEKLVKSGRPFALFFLDLNKFKGVNDMYGHDKGDEVLITIAKRLHILSSHKIHISRVGGDEFTIIYEKAGKNDIVNMCQKVIKTINTPIIVDDFRFRIGVSIGIARFPEDADNTEDLVKFADLAMYESKKDDEDKDYKFYEKRFFQVALKNDNIEKKLRQGNFNKMFRIFFQPIIDTKTQKIAKVESLIRWFDDSLGYIPPSDFIPVAENIGAIDKITRWTIARSFYEFSIMHHKYGANFQLAINLSPKILNSSTVSFIHSGLSKYKLSPALLEFEITESNPLIANESTSSMFTHFHENNLSISIDDYGTGFSTLKYILNYKVKTIKIAKAIIDNIENFKKDRELVKSIVSLTKSLDIETIAEGVEFERQYEILKGLGVDYVQGYYFDKPMDFKSLVKKYLL